MNTTAPIRPEERRRRPFEGPGWADTVPACFRSEAFAEDLAEPVAAAPLVVRSIPLPLPPRRDQRHAAAQSAG